MKKINSYMTRALKSRDPRYKKILSKMGYDTGNLVADDAVEEKKKPRTLRVHIDVSKQIDNFHEQRDQQQPEVEQEVEQQPEVEQLDMAGLRNKYKEVLGKQPYYGWDEDTLRQKIKEAQE